MNRSLMISAVVTISLCGGMTAHAAVSPAMAVPVSEQAKTPPTSGTVATSGVMVGASLDAVRVFPNPWRADKHANQSITFDHVPPAATIKLFTVAGQYVKIIDADDNGAAVWDLTNDSSVKVASGLYLYLISTDDGQEIKGKLAIIR